MESKSLINLAKSPIGLKIVPTTSLILLVFFFLLQKIHHGRGDCSSLSKTKFLTLFNKLANTHNNFSYPN